MLEILPLLLMVVRTWLLRIPLPESALIVPVLVILVMLPPWLAMPKPVPDKLMVPLLVTVEPKPDIVTALLAADADCVTPLLIVIAQLTPASAIGVELLLEIVTGQTTANAFGAMAHKNATDAVFFLFKFNLNPSVKS